MEGPIRDDPTPADRLELRLLGGFWLGLRGRAIAPQTWRRAHPRRLLELLGSSRQHWERRSVVLNELWPGADASRARNRLHHTVHLLRKAFDELPPEHRPVLNVGTERVTLVLPAHAWVDIHSFTALADAEPGSPAERLAQLHEAVTLYAGELAPDWLDCEPIEARRAWLADRHRQALHEGVRLAHRSGDLPRALAFTQLGLKHHPDDMALHAARVDVLAQMGQVDAALLYGQEVRQALIDRGLPSGHPDRACLDDVIRQAQQQHNQAAAPASLAPVPGPADDVPLRIAAPDEVLLGVDDAVQVALQRAQSPHSRIVSLVGAPGSGKTAWARRLAHALQQHTAHGGVWLDMDASPDAPGLLRALARALSRPELGSLPPEEDVIVAQLRLRELLVVLDDWSPHADARELLHRLSARTAQTRWLRTGAWSLDLPGECIVRVEPLPTAAPASTDDAASGPLDALEPALRLLLANWADAPASPDAQQLDTLRRLVQAVDGLPGAVRGLGRLLGTQTLDELWQQVSDAPQRLLNLPDTVSPEWARLGRRWKALVASVDAHHLAPLLAAATVHSACSRADLCRLAGMDEAPRTEAWIAAGLRGQLLWRLEQTSSMGRVSVFRMPALARAAVLAAHGPMGTASSGASPALHRWMLASARAQPDALSRAAWVDEHVADVEALAAQLGQAADTAALFALAAAFAPGWSQVRDAHRVLRWLGTVTPPEAGTDAGVAAGVMVERAVLWRRVGDVARAMQDARQALSWLADQPDHPMRQQALSLLAHGVPPDQGQAKPTVQLVQRAYALDAAQQLLRQAQSLRRPSQWPQAIRLARQAADHFLRWQDTGAVLCCLRLQWTFAHAGGLLEKAEDIVAEFREHAGRPDAQGISDQDGHARHIAQADLMHAAVTLGQGRFEVAAAQATDVLSRPPVWAHPVMMARGYELLSWAHGQTQAWPLMRLTAQEMNRLAAAAGHMALALRGQLLGHLGAARQLGAHGGADESGRVPSWRGLQPDALAHDSLDPQCDHLLAAELAVALNRHDLARAALAGLAGLLQAPQLRLRPAVAERAQTLAQALDRSGIAASPTVPLPLHRVYAGLLAA